MNEELPIAIVVPTCNMRDALRSLLADLLSTETYRFVSDILFVDDGSTDGSADLIEDFANAHPQTKIRCLRLPQNKGRFLARFEGAKEARGERILFLDTRIELPANFAMGLKQAAEATCAMGWVDLPIERNVFCLYWNRSHRFIFRNNFRYEHSQVNITAENFESFVKGTGVFLVERKLFLDVCVSLPSDLLSDDTALMREVVKEVPITIHPDLRVVWVPRENWQEFLWRIWDRGPGFAEYHLFERQGKFFWIVTAGLGLAAGTTVLIIAVPPIGATLLAAELTLLVASTAAFAKSPKEFVRMAPLHTATALMFGAAAIRGIAVNANKRLQQRFAKTDQATLDARTS